MENEFPDINSITTSTPKKRNLWQTIRRRWWVVAVVTAGVFGVSAILSFRKIPIYQSEALILINNNSISVVPGTGAGNDAGAFEDLSTEIQVLKSRGLVSQALSQVKKPYQDISVDQVVGNIYIYQPNKTGILNISYADTDPNRTKVVLDALSNTYIKYSSQRKRSRATNAIKLIEDQLPDATKKLNESAFALTMFRQQYGLIDPTSYGTTLLQRQQALEQEAQQVRLSIDRTQRQYQELLRQIGQVSQNPQTTLSDAILSQDITYRNLIGQLKDLDSQLAAERIRFQENHPRIADLKVRREQIISALQTQGKLVLGTKSSQILPKGLIAGETQQSLTNQLLEVKTKLAIESTSLKNLVQAQANITDRFKQIPYLEQNYIELKERFARNSENVNYFLNKLQELRIAEAQDTSSWQILEAAYVPGNPVSPDHKRDLTMGLVVGSLLGLTLAFLWERWDRTIKAVNEARQASQMPLIGTVPQLNRQKWDGKFGKDRNIAWEESREYERSPFIESFRSLAISLMSWPAQQYPQTIMFTSAIAGEGKTTIAYNLGVVLTSLDRKVLLVDSNTYKPTLHEVIQKPNHVGLSEAISTDRPWQELIQTTSYPKLDVMTAGAPRENFVALLLSDKMKRLLSEWKQAYDYVLIDTPAILNFTEAQSLGSIVDGIVLVVGLERSTPEAISRTLEILQGNESRLMGMVVNFVPAENPPKSYLSPITNHQKLLPESTVSVKDR